MTSEVLNSLSVSAVDPLTSNTLPVVGGGELLNMGVSVAIVIAAILLLGWFYSKSRILNASASSVINVVASRALGPKERLMVIEVADQQLLLGMTAAGVRTLHVFDKPIVLPDATVPTAGFAARLRSSIQEMRR